MPGANIRTNGRRFVSLLALTSIAVGAARLFRPTPHVSGRGIPRTPPSYESVTHGVEVTDISARVVALILAGLAATTAAAVGIVFIMGWRFDVDRAATNSVLTTEQRSTMIPPAPHLQRNPFDDLARVQARESRILNTYGWIDVNHTVARIPIARAMQITVGKSLDGAP